MNNKEEKSVLIDGISYPAILTDVKLVYDKEKGVRALRFSYRIYVNYSHVKEVEKDFYLYNVAKYRCRTIERLIKYLGLYDLRLMYKEYQDEYKILSGCRWLVGTRIEVKQGNYKGEKRYTLVATERTEYRKVMELWESMLKNGLSTYPEYKQNSMPVLDEYAWYKY